MCELFGASLRVPTDLSEYLETFYHHSEKHPHGWGIMRYRENQYEILKAPVKASASDVLPGIIKETGLQKNLLAHIRLATVGSIKLENCHPYVGTDSSGRVWTLIHNGTIYSSKTLMKYLSVQEGDTDSERVLLYLISKANEALEEKEILSDEDRFDVIESLVLELSKRNKLNLMIFDGEVLYIHKNMKNTLSYKELPEGKIFATSPLDDEFIELPMCKLFALKDGVTIRESQTCTEEFIPTLEYISAMAAMNI